MTQFIKIYLNFKINFINFELDILVKFLNKLVETKLQEKKKKPLIFTISLEFKTTKTKSNTNKIQHILVLHNSAKLVDYESQFVYVGVIFDKFLIRIFYILFI